MAIYWLLFTLPAVALFAPVKLTPRSSPFAWLMIALGFSLVIGFRHEVGADWSAYLGHFDYISSLSFLDALRFSDPGYYALNWVVAQFGGSVYLVNWIAACLVMAGVVVFARQQPQPWIALLVAVPYLIVVVSMGYTRQAAALGLVMIGLAALGQQRVIKFVVWVLLGALFHKSAVLLLPIAAVAVSRQRLWTAFWIMVTAGVGTVMLVLDDADALWKNYVEAEYHSEGGLIRVAMNAVPAVLLILFRRRLKVREDERRLWLWMAFFSLVCIPLVLISSTAVDRVALYFIPIQLYVFSHLHRMARRPDARAVITLAIVGYYALVLYVWLNYAAHAIYWVPYHFHFVPLE